MDVLISNITEAEVAALTTRMNRSNAERKEENVKLAAQVPPGQPLAIFQKWPAYVQFIVAALVADIVKDEAAQIRTAALRKVQDAPASVTAEDKAVLGIK